MTLFIDEPPHSFLCFSTSKQQISGAVLMTTVLWFTELVGISHQPQSFPGRSSTPVLHKEIGNYHNLYSKMKCYLANINISFVAFNFARNDHECKFSMVSRIFYVSKWALIKIRNLYIYYYFIVHIWMIDMSRGVKNILWGLSSVTSSTVYYPRCGVFCRWFCLHDSNYFMVWLWETKR